MSPWVVHNTFLASGPDFKRGVTEAEWMPDGRSLAVVATDDESYDLHGERKGDETATVRVLRHVDWRMDGDGGSFVRRRRGAEESFGRGCWRRSDRS